MSKAAESERIALVPLDLANLRRLAASEAIDLGAMAISAGALPPAKVATRALTQLDLGTPPFWCVPFLVVSEARQAVLGGCGFKSAPVDGTVEISYGVARSERGRGVATAAVGRLLQLAAASGRVQQVVAHILPDNAASSRVVLRLGFSSGKALVDSDGETVVPWTRRISP